MIHALLFPYVADFEELIKLYLLAVMIFENSKYVLWNRPNNIIDSVVPDNMAETYDSSVIQ